MRKILLTADDGETLVGQLPESWAEVPLAPYAALASAELLPHKVRALAALVGLPPEPLLANIRHYGVIRQAAPWLFSGELPGAGEPVPSFKHEGVTYSHVGPLDVVSAQQMEALFNFLAEAEGQPLTAAPGLLAVLYCPKGKEQTAAVVAQAQAAFTTLPVSIAYPCLQRFIRSSGPCATSILTASALSAQLGEALSQFETSLRTPGASHISFLNLRRKLGLMWIRRARKML